MKTIDLLDAQKHLAKMMREVCETSEPISIDGLGEHEVVLLPMSTFKNNPSQHFSEDKRVTRSSKLKAKTKKRTE